MIFHPTFRLVVLGTLLLGTETATRALDREVVVSVYQGECKDGDFAANLVAVRDAVRLARARGSHFVVFPECFLSTVTADMFRAPWVWGDVNDVPAWLRTQLGQMLTESEPPVGGN